MSYIEVSVNVCIFVYSPCKEIYTTSFVRKHSADWDSHSKSLGTLGLSRPRMEQGPVSSDLDNISGRVDFFSTRGLHCQTAKQRL